MGREFHNHFQNAFISLSTYGTGGAASIARTPGFDLSLLRQFDLSVDFIGATRVWPRNQKKERTLRTVEGQGMRLISMGEVSSTARSSMNLLASG